uniref:3CxxC-type domain-containing protein n=1 Tax=Ditylenchus dipsaci TaxID=166011 RepID=A0A915EAZ3_9BILA
MFEYDRLALDVAQQFTASSQVARHSLLEFSRLPAYSKAKSQAFSPQTENSTIGLQEEQSRRLSGGSTLLRQSWTYRNSSCLSSPNSTHYLAHQLHKMLMDQDFSDTTSQPSSPPKSKPQATIPQPSSNFWTSHLEGIYPKTNVVKEDVSCCPTMVSSPTPMDNSRKVSLAGSEASAAAVVASKEGAPTRYQCHICYQTGHYISDCPLRFNSPYEELTPYQGRKKCYGEFQCQQCKRKWTSQNSVANEAQSCIKCHVPVFPHKQLPVDKAVALGLVKSQRVLPTKISPIGHGRPEPSLHQHNSSHSAVIGLGSATTAF